jgi:hypothetical protein
MFNDHSQISICLVLCIPVDSRQNSAPAFPLDVDILQTPSYTYLSTVNLSDGVDDIRIILKVDSLQRCCNAT